MQQPVSVRTATTAVSAADGSAENDSILIGMPKTPPVLALVEGSRNGKDDGCSPLGIPNFALRDL